MNKNKTFLSFSFSKGFVSPNIPIATFYQGDKELNFIIDTGSDNNVINSGALKDIKYEKLDHKGTLAGVGGVFDVEACNISFQHEGETFTTKFLISDLNVNDTEPYEDRLFTNTSSSPFSNSVR